MGKHPSKLADALSALRRLQCGGRGVFRSGEFSRLHRERLVRQGYLRPVLRGWLLSTSPSAEPGDSTPWFAAYWEFIATYCESRLGKAWHLAPEPSLLLHVDDWTIPRQLLVHGSRAGNRPIDLPFASSLLTIRPSRRTREDEVVRHQGLRLLTVEAALVRLPESSFRRWPREIRTALTTRASISDLLRILLEGSHPVVAGRLAGALRQLGRDADADEIVGTMRTAGHDTRETLPFTEPRPAAAEREPSSPLVSRLRALWSEMRDEVVRHFPAAPGRPDDVTGYLARLDDRCMSDTYHSLSIEGYQVSEAMIEKVRSGNWDAEGVDGSSRDAMAARGYAQAFDFVRTSVEKVLWGDNPGTVARADHRLWYREMFAPSVAAGILAPRDLAGYRGGPVFIRASRHVPPRAEALTEALPALFELLENESEPAVLATLGHWLFGYLHPYPDGNGRMARFLMNTMLAAGGFPWTVIRVEDRNEYMAALESASVEGDIGPFARFLGARMHGE